MGLLLHHIVIYGILGAVALAELVLLVDAYTRFAPFEGEVSVKLGTALRSGIIGAALTLAGSFVLLTIGFLVRTWISWYWHVAFQTLLLVYWITAATCLQVSFAKLPNKDCEEIYGDEVCSEGVAARVLAFILLILPAIFIPVFLYLDVESYDSYRQSWILGKRPISASVTPTTAQTPQFTFAAGSGGVVEEEGSASSSEARIRSSIPSLGPASGRYGDL